MELREFILQEKELLDGFAWTYAQHIKKGKALTNIRPAEEWTILLTEYLETRKDGNQRQSEAA